MRWRTLRSLRVAELGLLLESALLLLAYGVGFTLLSPKSCLRIQAAACEDGDVSPGVVRRVSWAVGAVDRRLLGSSCLRRSAALAHMLRRRGYACELRFGAANKEGELVAHAWVERRGQAVLDPSGPPDYLPLESREARRSHEAR